MWLLNYSNVIDPILKNVRIRVIKLSGIKAEDKVLDVCCGTGDQAFYYVRAGAFAYGIDLNPKMIEVAEKNKKKLNLNNIYFQVADAQSLPFEDNFFDYVSISFGLHEKDREVRDIIISEMRRVVKKGGILIFIDFQIPLPKGIYSFLVNRIERFAGNDHYQYFEDYLRRGGLREILRKNQLFIERNERKKNGIFEIITVRN